jgi:haloacetate dehalogenase
MSELQDLYKGFATHWIDTNAGKIFARSHGEGQALLLLHGFPQTHVMWHKIAAKLAESFKVVVMDLRGYGWSSAPHSDQGEFYTKRLMAEDAIEVMRQLGHLRFSMAGHDRGGRVAYRLALDHPERVDRLAVLDIVPTAAMWRNMDALNAQKSYHWLFLAQPEPLPERLIGPNAHYFLEHTLRSWTAAKDLETFDPRALNHYRAAYNEPSRIHAACEDYRAGATFDRNLDEADFASGHKISVPLYALWGDKGIPARGFSPLEVWRLWAHQAAGSAIKSGHFLAEENPEATLEVLTNFFKA